MKLKTFKTILFAVGLATLCACSPSVEIEREVDFNFDWKFTLLPDTTTLKNLPLSDSDWRDVRLPHDWSVEHSFDKNLEGCTGYLPGGVGVYQKHFTTTESSDLKNTFILFDGVYNNSKYWLNGEYIGENPYGYSPVYFDITKILKPVGEENILTVYVDHSRYADSRWYTGSGIYRNVKLVTVNKLHIPIWGTFVTTPEITDADAKVNLEVKINNENSTEQEFTLKTSVFDNSARVVAKDEKVLSIGANSNISHNQTMAVSTPKLWSPETPNMYRAVTTIESNGKVIDQYTTPFGIRSIRFDKDKGFFLNGVSTYIKGVCLHHDGGLVGAAVPEGVWRRRFAALKAGGVNAIRTAHNPFSEEFLNLCDEMGFLVQDEIFDEMDNPKDKRLNMWERETLYRTDGYDEHFQEWAESDLKRTIMRDRNHPSVFQYSIGNEIEWTYPDYKHVSGLWDPGAGGYWNATPKLTPEEMKARYDALPERKYVLAETAEKLARWVKEIDTTRPVTANLIIPTASCVSGYAAALDVVGISYQIAQYDWCKKHFPDMMFTGNENSGTLDEWRTVTDNPMVFSIFMWTGINYMGEARDRWPQKGSNGDMLDLAGFKKAGWNHFRAIWDDVPFAAIQTRLPAAPVKNKKIATKWDNSTAKELWNYKDGETVSVEVITNQPEAELFLNGKSLGSVKLSDCYADNIMRWSVPYQAGTLVVKAGDITTELKSAETAAALKLDVDQKQLKCDGYDVAHIEVQVIDANGIPVKIEEHKIKFDVKGDIKLLGVDNGWYKSTQDFQATSVETRLGRCIAIVQSKRGVKGKATITVSADGLPSQKVKIQVK